jgi:maltooligosyltrehalose trehalohydrolase
MHFSPERLVYCISNHDQVGNRPLGERLHHSVTPEIYRAVSVMLCLCPYTPMLFMGQEWAASTPFKFFTDLPPEIGQHMDQYRIAEFRKYGFPIDDEVIRKMGHPQDEYTFRSSKLQWSEVSKSPHELCWHLYRECLQLRKHQAIFQNRSKDSWQVKKVGTSMVGIRWHDDSGDWLLLITLLQPSLVNWSEDSFISPKTGMRWHPILYSNESRFGGTGGTPMLFGDKNSTELVGAGSWLMRERAEMAE